jgi:hypothetical protein
MQNLVGGEKASSTVEYKPSDPALVKRAQKLIASNPARWTQKELGDSIGRFTAHGPYSGSYVSTWLKGRWTGSEFEDGVPKFLDSINDQASREKAAEFVIENSITADVRIWLDRCYQLGRCAAITGDPGIGKTLCLARFMRQKPGLVFNIQAGPRRNRAADIERTLVDIIGEQDDIFQTASNRSDCIVRYLIRYPRLIVIEDFDMLHRSALEFLLRDLWNQLEDNGRGLPIVMIGNIEGIAKMQKLPAQIRSRLRPVHLKTDKAFPLSFVRKFMQHHLGDDLEVTPAMAHTGVKIANDPNHGHLRTLENLCVECRDAVGRDEGAPEETFTDLHDEILQTRALIDRRPVTRNLAPQIERRQLAEVA